MIDEKKNELMKEYNIENYNKNELEIKLIGINDITYIYYMLYDYTSLFIYLIFQNRILKL